MLRDLSPRISVVIPSFNRSRLLSECLTSLSNQTAEGDFEVIVVLDGSTDDSAEMLESARWRFALTVLKQPRQRQGAARNFGVSVAAAPTVLFLDDDMVLEPDAVACHIAAHRAQPDIIGVGEIDTSVVHAGLPQLVNSFWEPRRRRLRAGATATFLDCFSGHLSVPIRAFRACGGFDTTLRRSEDLELGYRLTKAGLRCRYLPGARSTQRFTKTTGQLLAAAEGEGAAAVHLWRKHPVIRRQFHPGGVTSARGVPSALLRSIPTLPLQALAPIAAALPGNSAAAVMLQARLAEALRVRGMRHAASEREWRALSSTLRVFRVDQDSLHDSPADFKRLVRSLGAGELTTLRAYLADLEAPMPKAASNVVFSFDCCNQRETECVSALLETAPVPATVFLTSPELGGAFASSLVEIGVLADPQWSQPQEFVRMRQRFGERFGSEPVSLAWTAKVDPLVRGYAADAGFQLACQRGPGPRGWHAEPHSLPRLPLNAMTPPPELWTLRTAGIQLPAWAREAARALSTRAPGSRSRLHSRRR